MRVFFTIRFAVRLAAFCLLAGFVLGFHLGTAAAARSTSNSSNAEITDFRHSPPAVPCAGEEVPQWSPTPALSWSCSAGS